MHVESLELPEVRYIRPAVYRDERGFFLEAWNRRRFAEHGLPTDFTQLNHSRSGRGILRGMHLQVSQPQGKLVRVLAGRVFDVAVDARPDSATFGHWCGRVLDAAEPGWLWVPEGFAHGFCVLGDSADFEYLCTSYYDPQDEVGFRWNDPRVGIKWPLEAPTLSAKDREAPLLEELLPRLRQAGS